MKQQNKLTGYLLGIAAAVSYGLNPTFALPLYSNGLNPESVLLLRYGFAIPIVALMMLVWKRSFKVQKKAILPLACLGILMALSSLTLFVSYKHMAAGIASTILFVYPIFVAILMTIFCKEKITIPTVLCLVIASIGILLLYRTSSGDTLSLVGTLLVIASAISYAVYLVWVGRGSISKISTLTLTFYVLCFGSLLFAGSLLVTKQTFTLPSEWYLWLDAFALALFPTAISLLCTKGAIEKIGSTPTAILGALEPVTALIMGFLFFHEGMTAREAIGIVLILLAVSIVVGQRKHKKSL